MAFVVENGIPIDVWNNCNVIGVIEDEKQSRLLSSFTSHHLISCHWEASELSV